MDRFNPFNLFRKTVPVSSTSTSAPGSDSKGPRVDPSGTRRAGQPQGSGLGLRLLGQQPATLPRAGDGRGGGQSTSGLLPPGKLVTDSGMPAALYWPGVPEVMHGYLDDPADRAVYPPRLTPATPTSTLSPMVWDAHPITSPEAFLLHPGQSVWISTHDRPAVVYEAVVAGHYVHDSPVTVARRSAYQPGPSDALVVRPRGHWDPDSLEWDKPVSGGSLEWARDSAGNPWLTLRRDSGVTVHARKLPRVPQALTTHDLDFLGLGARVRVSPGTRLLLPVYYGWGGNPNERIALVHGCHHLPVHFVGVDHLSAILLTRHSIDRHMPWRFDPLAPAPTGADFNFGLARRYRQAQEGKHQGCLTFPGGLDAHPIRSIHRINGEGFHEHFGDWHHVSSKPVGDGWFEIRLTYRSGRCETGTSVGLLKDFYPDDDEPGEALLRRTGGTDVVDMPSALRVPEVLNILLEYNDGDHLRQSWLLSQSQPRMKRGPVLQPSGGQVRAYGINSPGVFLLPPGTPVRVSSLTGTGPDFSGVVAGSVIQNEAMDKARASDDYVPSPGDRLVVYCAGDLTSPGAQRAGVPQVHKAPGCGTWVTLRRNSGVVVHAETRTAPLRMLSAAELVKMPVGTPLLLRMGLFAPAPPEYGQTSRSALLGSQDVPVLLDFSRKPSSVWLVAHWDLHDLGRTAGSLLGPDLVAEPIAHSSQPLLFCLDRREGVFKMRLDFDSATDTHTGLLLNPFYTGGYRRDGVAPPDELEDASPVDDKQPRETTANDLYEPVWGGHRAQVSSRMTRQEARTLQPGDRVSLRLKEKGAGFELAQFQTGAGFEDRVESLDGGLILVLALDGGKGSFHLQVGPEQEMPLIWGQGLAFGDDKTQDRGRNLDTHLECTVAGLGSADELEALLETSRAAGQPAPRVNLVLPGADHGEDFVVTQVVREGNEAFVSIEARDNHPILKNAPNQQSVTTTSGMREYQVLLKFDRSSIAGEDDKAPAREPR